MDYKWVAEPDILAALTDAKRPYAAMAREALAIEELMTGHANQARSDFVVLSLMADAPNDVRERAKIAMAMIDSGGVSGLQAIVTAASALPATHLVFGNIEEFLEADQEPAWQAVLAVTVVLRAQKETDIMKSILLQKTYTATETCKFKNPQAVAEAMSRAMAQVSQQIIRDIHQALVITTP